MDKKKSMVISIFVVLLIIALVSGTTYAYLLANTNEVNVDTGSGMLGVNYNISPENITGSLVSSLDREKGLKAVATVSLTTDSEAALFNMYIMPTALTNLNITAFKWEVEGILDEEVVYTNSGNFSSAIVNIPIKIVDSYPLILTEKETTFNIYMWLNANEITSSIDGASFGAKINADSVNISGSF